MYYDLGIRSGDLATLNMAHRLGYAGVGVLQPLSASVQGLDIGKGTILQPSKVAGHRKAWELIAVEGREREAAETPGVDILFPRELDYVMIRLAKHNGVLIGFSFHAILHAAPHERAELMGVYTQFAKLVTKYKVPFVLTSGAEHAMDLRSPQDLIAFGRTLGLPHPETGLSGARLKENRTRLSHGWVMPGVRTR